MPCLAAYVLPCRMACPGAYCVPSLCSLGMQHHLEPGGGRTGQHSLGGPCPPHQRSAPGCSLTGRHLARALSPPPGVPSSQKPAMHARSLWGSPNSIRFTRGHLLSFITSTPHCIHPCLAILPAGPTQRLAHGEARADQGAAVTAAIWSWLTVQREKDVCRNPMSCHAALKWELHQNSVLHELHVACCIKDAA